MNKNQEIVYATNKSVFFHYEIGASFVAGLVLHGWEVKSVRSKHLNIKGAWISIRNGELWLLKSDISPFKNGNGEMERLRERKLLLKKSEIKKIESLITEKGRSVLITKVFASGRHIKAEIVVGKGKKKHEKRESLKNRDLKRKMKKDFGV